MEATYRLMVDVYKNNYPVKSKLFLKLLKHMVKTIGTDATEHFVSQEFKQEQQ